MKTGKQVAELQRALGRGDHQAVTWGELRSVFDHGGSIDAPDDAGDQESQVGGAAGAGKKGGSRKR